MAMTDNAFFAQRLWLGWSRWTWVRLAFLFMFLVSAFGIYRIQSNSDEDVARSRQIAVEQCQRGNGVRQVIRDLVVSTYSSGESIDVTAFPHYKSLDPTTKAWVDDLNDKLSSASTPEARQQRVNDALATVPLINCDTITK